VKQTEFDLKFDHIPGLKYYIRSLEWTRARKACLQTQ